MILSWLFLIGSSILFGVGVTLAIEFYFFKKYFFHQRTVNPKLKIPLQPFELPKILLESIRSKQPTGKESCTAVNLLLQFLFHELRDTEKIRKWFRNKLSLEFEELLSRSAIGRMIGSIKICDINLGSEFPVLNSIVVQNVNVNKDFSHIDSLDLKLDVNYCGGFELIVNANMLLGKAAYVSIKVLELNGEGRLQFTRLPYSHWSFTFYNEPKLQLQVESLFQGRPLPQITNLIASQIRKSLKKKHTLPHYKLRYKPFFSISENVFPASNISPGRLQIIIHQVSRLNEMASDHEIYCLAAVDSLPWVEIVNHKNSSYYVLDLIITKKLSQQLGFIFKQEFSEERSQTCVILENVIPDTPASKGEACRGDVIVSIDGKKVTNLHQAPKFIKSAAVQFTLRVERQLQKKIIEEKSSNVAEIQPTPQAWFSGLRKRKGSETDSCNSSPPASLSSSPAKRLGSSPEHKKLTTTAPKSLDLTYDNEFNLGMSKTKPVSHNQVVQFQESFNVNVGPEDKYLNINVRTNETSGQKDKLLGYINVPLSELQNLSDFIKSFQLKPPDSFAASNSRNYKLSGQNGFIPLLCYGDILLTLQHVPSVEAASSPVLTAVKSLSSETVGSADSSTLSSRPASGERKHDFIRTQFQTSTQCTFCGKKIWLKDAEKCRNCGMTCHKKCVTKCKAETICNPEGKKSQLDDAYDPNRRPSVQPEIITTSPEETPQPTPKKGLGSLLASVASASRGLKRVGSANNLALPGNQCVNVQSKSLPPSPQQSPAPSRKPSLPMELSEDITTLLQTLMQQGSDQGDMMGFAKESGKTLYEDLNLSERKAKINEMINKLKSAIDSESEIRFTLAKEEQTSKDPTNKTKTAFLIGKSDQKAEALTVLMLHFCAGLQHIQDLEEQEKETFMANESYMKE